MTDFYKRITEMQGTVEDLARQVPGFKGYFEKQDRRAADKLLREKLARTFGEHLQEFARVQNKLVDGGGIKFMEQAQRITTRLQTLIDKIESAPRGYAGLFDAIKVDEQSLANVYAFDNSLFVYQDQLASGLRVLRDAAGTDGVGGALDQLDQLVTELADTFSKRIDLLQGIQPSV